MADNTRCAWTESEHGVWDTGCGNAFLMNEGTPLDNVMCFCCYCGREIFQVLFSEEED